MKKWANERCLEARPLSKLITAKLAKVDKVQSVDDRLASCQTREELKRQLWLGLHSLGTDEAASAGGRMGDSERPIGIPTANDTQSRRAWSECAARQNKYQRNEQFTKRPLAAKSSPDFLRAKMGNTIFLRTTGNPVVASEPSRKVRKVGLLSKQRIGEEFAPALPPTSFD
uniref:Uncharacterized protein n=1 Tax=Trichuris muris TaxID=70415 RepID=A0A5S6R467_TRIMR